MKRMLVTLEVSQCEMSSSKSVAAKNSSDMSVMRLVFHVEMFPYVVTAALLSSCQSYTAICSSSLLLGVKDALPPFATVARMRITMSALEEVRLRADVHLAPYVPDLAQEHASAWCVFERSRPKASHAPAVDCS